MYVSEGQSNIVLCKVHKKRPASRLTLQYDKLHVDNAIYVFNDETDKIELLNLAEIQAEYETVFREYVVQYTWLTPYNPEYFKSISVPLQIKTRQKVL